MRLGALYRGSNVLRYWLVDIFARYQEEPGNAGAEEEPPLRKATYRREDCRRC